MSGRRRDEADAVSRELPDRISEINMLNACRPVPIGKIL
jgi:hypothetical protein